MPESSERLNRFHGTLLGGAPSAKQGALYEGFPSVLGVSSEALDLDLFRAALILALLQAGKSEHGEGLHKVYFLVPAASTDGWVLAAFKSTAKHIFDRLKGGKSTDLIKHVGELFHMVMLGSQVFALPREPDRWVAFGFSKSTPIPDWMRPKLLDPAETPQQIRAGV